MFFNFIYTSKNKQKLKDLRVSFKRLLKLASEKVQLSSNQQIYMAEKMTFISLFNFFTFLGYIFLYKLKTRLRNELLKKTTNC